MGVSGGGVSGDGVGEVAVVIQCHAGGLGLPDHVLVHGPGPTHLATVAPGGHDGQPGGLRFVPQITVEQGWLHLEWVGHGPGDAMAEPSLLITARARLDGGHLQVRDVEVLDERAVAHVARAGAAGDAGSAAGAASGSLIIERWGSSAPRCP